MGVCLERLGAVEGRANTVALDCVVVGRTEGIGNRDIIIIVTTNF